MAHDDELEAQIDRWRGYVHRRQVISSADVDELEDHLRGQVTDLRATGLDDDEAFLVAIKRLGNLDAVSREYAREHSDRLWKQLALVPDDSAGVAGTAVARARGRDRARGRRGRRGHGPGSPGSATTRSRSRATSACSSCRSSPRTSGGSARLGRADRRGDRRAVRRARRRAQRLPVRPRGVDRGARRSCTRPSSCGCWSGSRTSPGRGAPTADAWTSCGSPASSRSTTRCSRSAAGSSSASPPGCCSSSGVDPEPVHHGLGAAVRRPGRPRRRRLAGRGQAGRRREHRARADPGLHAADHRHARGRPRGADRLRRLRRGRPRPAHPDGRDPRAGPGAAALLDLGPRPARAARARPTGSSSSWWARPSRSTP